MCDPLACSLPSARGGVRNGEITQKLNQRSTHEHAYILYQLTQAQRNNRSDIFTNF